MALFGDNKRTAAVRASVKSEVIFVTKKTLITQFNKIPEWLVTMINTIAKNVFII